METQIPVLIIGTGPSGATTALHLARMGIKSLMISRHRGCANTPRAHIFNQRAMEVLRDAGLEDILKPVASPAYDLQHTSWLHTLAGEEYGRLWAWGNKPSQLGDYEAASPCCMSDLPQSVLEPILVEEAVNFGSEVRFSTEFVSFEQKADRVLTKLLDRTTETIFTISSKYLVGADGARSGVVEALKIPIIGRQLNTAFNVHIKADLTKYIAHRPGSLNWVLNPDAPGWSAVGNFRMVRPWTEFVVSMHPATKDGVFATPSNEAILERLYQMIGDDTVGIEILSAFQWTINDQVAEKWQEGRVLCIGDATHRHPPINGLGSNTCLSDAFNLSWKLAHVLKGFGSPSLLNTLTPERKPVGDAIVKRANAGMEAHRHLWGLLGLTPEARQQVTEKMEQANLAGATLRRELRDAFAATEDEVQALGIQMNQVYVGSSATLVEDGDQEPDFSHVNKLRETMITTFPGYHLPHVWLAADGQSRRVSTLDLAGKGKFTLFTGIGGKAWVDAANKITLRGGLPIKGYMVGYRCDYMDCYAEWIKVRGVGEDGVVLVRPDHFVAWRCETMVHDCVEKLNEVLNKILGNCNT